MEKYTKEQWGKWYAHKSNKERWIDSQERDIPAEAELLGLSEDEAERMYEDYLLTSQQ